MKGQSRMREQWWKARRQQWEKRETRSLPRPCPTIQVTWNYSFSFFKIGSQAFVRTHSCGSLSLSPLVVFCFRISRLSRMRRFVWRVAFFLSLKVAIILGSSQFMVPDGHSRACFEMPEMLFTDFEEDTSLKCWLILVLKETRIWPTYLRSGSQEQLSW